MDGLGKALLLLRGKRAQAAVAKGAGITAAMLSRYENEVRSPQAVTLGAVLDSLGVSVHDLAVALEQAQGKAGEPTGTPRPDWVSALTRAGLDADILQAFALGALSFATPRAEADFVESARAVATDLARAAVENARATYQVKPSD